MKSTAPLHLVPPPLPKRAKPVKDYRSWLKAKGVKPMKIERTPKRAGEYEFDHRGRLVEVRHG